MKDSSPFLVFESLNFGESIPITMSRLPKRSSSVFSAGSMWMQLMQPGVKKSSNTARPRRSRRVSGRRTLYQGRSAGNGTADCARAPGIPNQLPPTTTIAAMRTRSHRFEAAIARISPPALVEAVDRRVQRGDALLGEVWLRCEDVAPLEPLDVPSGLEQVPHLIVVHRKWRAIHLLRRIVQRDQESAAAARQAAIDVARIIPSYRRRQRDQRRTVVDRAAGRKGSAIDMEDIAADDFNAAAGWIGDFVARAAVAGQ